MYASSPTPLSWRFVLLLVAAAILKFSRVGIRRCSDGYFTGHNSSSASGGSGGAFASRESPTSSGEGVVVLNGALGLLSRAGVAIGRCGPWHLLARVRRLAWVLLGAGAGAVGASAAPFVP